jgi:hypothetical protein
VLQKDVANEGKPNVRNMHDGEFFVISDTLQLASG